MPLDSLTIEPPPAALLAAIRHRRSHAGANRQCLGRSLAEWCALTRRELGLSPTDAVIMSGHQAAFWHPGIVVKSLLADGLALAAHGVAAHVVVEQDVEPVASVAVPVRSPDGQLRRTTVAFLRQPPEVTAGALPPFTPAAVPELPAAIPGTGTALERMGVALHARREESNAALQVTRAAFDLLAPIIATPTLISPSALLRTTLAGALLERMAVDPAAAARAYNEAAATGSAATPLRILDDRVEVPLWRIDEQGRRLRAWDDDLDRFRSGAVTLLPRALLMTGLLRLAACDLFIHGSGGIAYDAAMERWLVNWLDADVAPAALATATMRLPFPETQQAPADLVAAQRAWRDAWFDPERLGAHRKRHAHPGPEKRGHLQVIDALPRGSHERRRAWRSMHDRLEDLREAHGESLAACRATLEQAQRDARARPIVDDRTWAFPLHGDEAMAELGANVGAKVGANSGTGSRANSGTNLGAEPGRAIGDG